MNTELISLLVVLSRLRFAQALILGRLRMNFASRIEYVRLLSHDDCHTNPGTSSRVSKRMYNLYALCTSASSQWEQYNVIWHVMRILHRRLSKAPSFGDGGLLRRSVQTDKADDSMTVRSSSVRSIASQLQLTAVAQSLSARSWYSAMSPLPQVLSMQLYRLSTNAGSLHRQLASDSMLQFP